MEQLTPLTREEEVLNTLLQAANGGTVENLNPEWRKEKWFQNILDAIKGNELTYDLVSEWRREDWYQAFIDAIQEGGGGGGSVPEYEGPYTVTPTEQTQTLSTKDTKCTDDVTVNPIPSSYIVPTGTKSITENGTGIDVAAYADVDVNVPTGITPTGTIQITQNGQVDVTQYATADVNVSGGSTADVPMKDVTFYDYDGTRLYSYTAQEFLALDAMPANPTHSGLTAQGWNWTLSDAKAQVTAVKSCNIGQNYITSDGKTRIYIHLDEGRLAPHLGLVVNGSVDVDWGDDTSHSILTGTDELKNVEHIYQSYGDYIISLTVSGSISLTGTDTEGSYLVWAFLSGSTGSNYNRVYQAAIQKIEIGSSCQIDNYAFKNCYKLMSVTIPSTLASIGDGAFYGCSSMRSVVIPSQISRVPYRAFYSCMGLQTLPPLPNLTEIGQESFSGDSVLASIVIPQNVTLIDTYAFRNCVGIGLIRFASTTPQSVGSSAFPALIGAKIIVPSGSLTAYTSASGYPSSSSNTYEEA